MAKTAAAAPETGAGGEAAREAQIEVTDENSAAAAIERLGLLDLGDEPDEEPGGEKESGADDAPDTGADDDQPTGEDDEGQDEPTRQAAATAIEPPVSWSAEDKAVFSKLPPEAQAVVARRESERDKLLTQTTQESADQRKAFEADRTAFDGARQQYIKSLNELVQLALPEAQQFAQIDWAKLAAENPAAYVQLSAQRDQLRQRIGTVQNELARVSDEQTKEEQKRVQEIMGEQKKLLLSWVPEFGDAEKGPKLAKELTTFVTESYGFSPQEVAAAADARVFRAFVDLMRYRQAESARKVAEGKRANSPPQVQRPGSTTADDTGNRRVRENFQRLARTGSTRDAASILEGIL